MRYDIMRLTLFLNYIIMAKITKTSTNDVCKPYGKSIIEIMKDRGLVIWADDMENYIKFTDYMELQKERDNRKALSEEREKNCWALAKVVDQQEKEIKKLREELETATKCSSQEEWKLRNLEKENEKLRDEVEELKERVEDSDRWEDYRWERCQKAEKQLLKIRCFINDEDYPYEK